MNLKSFLKRLIWGYEVLEKIDSPINGEITVVKDLFGHREMIVGGVCQSGGLVEKVWEVGIGAIRNTPACKRLAMSGRQYAKRNILILGLGGGNAAKLVSRGWPEAKIVGVEIDPKVVEVGERYFQLDQIPNLRVIVGDAVEAISNLQLAIRDGKFNLIVVDLYLGQEFPKEAENRDFLEGLKKILSTNGLVIFNRLYYSKRQKELANNFLEKIKEFFPTVTTKKAVTNLLIFASNFASKGYNIHKVKR